MKKLESQNKSKFKTLAELNNERKQFKDNKIQSFKVSHVQQSNFSLRIIYINLF